jgi:hypothetical protein
VPLDRDWMRRTFVLKPTKFIRADLRRLKKIPQNLSKHVMRDLGVLSGVLALPTMTFPLTSNIFVYSKSRQDIYSSKATYG